MSQVVTPLEIKQFLIDTLALEDIRPEDIGDDEPLFVEGLGLDSIDGLELDLALRKKYLIDSLGDSPSGRSHLASVNALAAFLSAKTLP